LSVLAQSLSADDLAWLGGYMAALSQEQANQLVTLLLDDPTLMAQLKDESVQAQVAASRDVHAVLRFLAAPLTLMSYGEDLLMLASGRIAFGLFYAKYGLWVSILSLLLPLLLILALARSLFMWLVGWWLMPLLGGLARRPSQTGQ
jgi:hypothetical protein